MATSGQRWTEAQVPDQFGKTVLITGANSGLGFENARALAAKGAKVVLGCRNPDKALTAIKQIKQLVPSADLEFLPLDLSSLASIHDAVDQFRRTQQRLDLLINNAGVMLLPQSTTEDGFDMQLGVNHLGHFALTGRLLDLLLESPNSRIVTVSSLAHQRGQIYFDNLQLRSGYGRFKAYAQSKLANLLFCYELQRKLTAAGATTISVAAHPGAAATNLGLPMFEAMQLSLLVKIAERVAPFIGQSAANGALPSLYAATADGVKGGQYFGPKFYEVFGPPVRVDSKRLSHNQEVAHRLWEMSRTMTGVGYEILERKTVAQLTAVGEE